MKQHEFDTILARLREIEEMPAKKKPAAKKKTKAPKGPVVVVRRGRDYLDMRAFGQRAIFLGVLNQIWGMRQVASHGLVFPLDELASIVETLQDTLREDYNFNDLSMQERAEFDGLFENLKNHFNGMLKNADKIRAKGELEFIDLPLVFRRENEVVCVSNGQLVGGIIKKVVAGETWTG